MKNYMLIALLLVNGLVWASDDNEHAMERVLSFQSDRVMRLRNGRRESEQEKQYIDECLLVARTTLSDRYWKQFNSARYFQGEVWTPFIVHLVPTVDSYIQMKEVATGNVQGEKLEAAVKTDNDNEVNTRKLIFAKKRTVTSEEYQNSPRAARDFVDDYFKTGLESLKYCTQEYRFTAYNRNVWLMTVPQSPIFLKNYMLMATMVHDAERQRQCAIIMSMNSDNEIKKEFDALINKMRERQKSKLAETAQAPEKKEDKNPTID